MNHDYKIKWTELGLAFAEAKASRERIEAQVRAELMEHPAVEEEVTLAFHTVIIGTIDDGVAFTVEPLYDGEDKLVAVEVDACHWEETTPITEGPFKGKKLMLPHPATKYRDDE